MNFTVNTTLIRLGMALLFLLAVAVVSYGLIVAWQHPGNDLYERFDEYRLYQQGVYPHAGIAGVNKHLPGFRTSVYPPFALPMFGAFFWGGAVLGLVIVQVLSLAALGGIAWYGYRTMRCAGSTAGALGALSAIAILGNFDNFVAWQFSIICMGLITAQLIFLEQNRPLPAGICWALAMIKPQIALPFALLFVLQRKTTGLIAGIGLLTGLCLIAFQRTGITLSSYLMAWTNKNSVHFVTEWNNNTLLSMMITKLEIPAPIAFCVLAAITIILVIAFILLLRLRRDRHTSPVDQLLKAGICCIGGAVTFYHHKYDAIMLYPALLATLKLAVTDPTPRRLALAGAMAFSLWIPNRLFTIFLHFPDYLFAQNLIRITVAISLLVLLTRNKNLDPG